MTRMDPRDLCTCGHQHAAHHKSESAKVSPTHAGELSKTDCALCYCARFKVQRLSEPSPSAMLTAPPAERSTVAQD
jgi:hypothetical protein